jgi:uncharacterized protein YukJ
MNTISAASKAMWISQFADDARRLQICLEQKVNDVNRDIWVQTTEHFTVSMTQTALRLSRFGVTLNLESFAWAENFMRRASKVAS